ncbi:MAG: DNA (cytosine-5-)-methyltransferase [Rhodospirillales bacterium]|nr:DNA (cytosine-5-)-methyltransferase [Rhodospirillales bacterium]
MRVAGLFAGIGGLELGLARQGHEVLLHCEIAAAARTVLAAHFSGVPGTPDVEKLQHLPANVELIAAGFPCQDLSQAGTTAGIEGTRSSLVSHIFRLLDAHRTPWVLLENVSFMLHLDRGLALRFLVDAFEQRGYRWAYRVVNSLAFVPQRRERVLLLATNTDADPADVLLADEAAPLEVPTCLERDAHGFYWTEGIRGLGWAPNAIPTLKNGSTIGIPSPPAILMPDGRVITPDIRDAEAFQGFPQDWTAPAVNVGRASLRWSLVGNAVTVPVAEWIGRRLASPGSYDRDRDRALGNATRWPRAARGHSGTRRAVHINAFPVWLDRPPLAAFLRHPGKLLSARATQGFLSRTERSTLRFVPGFRERVARHLARMHNQRGLWDAAPVAAE